MQFLLPIVLVYVLVTIRHYMWPVMPLSQIPYQAAALTSAWTVLRFLANPLQFTEIPTEVCPLITITSWKWLQRPSRCKRLTYWVRCQMCLTMSDAWSTKYQTQTNPWVIRCLKKHWFHLVWKGRERKLRLKLFFKKKNHVHKHFRESKCSCVTASPHKVRRDLLIGTLKVWKADYPLREKQLQKRADSLRGQL